MENHSTVLFISYYFPPWGLSGVQRSVKFAKYLPEFGWRPVVLTTAPTAYYAFDESLLEEVETSGAVIERTKAADITRFVKKGQTKAVVEFPGRLRQKLRSNILRVFLQPDNRVGWKKAALELGRRMIAEHDIKVIFATAPPFTSFLVARQLAQEFDLPFVVDYRDAWVDNPFHFYPTPFHKAYNIRLEEDVLKHTQNALVLSREAKERLLQRYGFLEHSDVTILPHGYDQEDFTALTTHRPDPTKFTLTHSGVFQDNRTPKYFLKAVRKFLDKHKSAREDVQLKFVGVLRRSETKLIKKYKLESLTTLTGYVPHAEAVQHIIESDVLWLMLKDTVRMPGKLYEYFGAYKPLLVCAPQGSVRATALESQAAVTTNPKDIDGIVKAIEFYYDLWQKQALPQPSKEFVQTFDRHHLTSHLSRVLGMALQL